MGQHTSFFSCFLSTLVMMAPGLFLFAYGLHFLMLVWFGVAIFSIIKGFSNRLWAQEIDRGEWKQKISFLSNLAKKHIKRVSN